mmetsp:Transcript_41961/g.119023  ORF Transcript_41961/g.119023 Transcript_41961/m.119023 type:complete len:138 (-) Transcript_41961:557-970(-)
MATPTKRQRPDPSGNGGHQGGSGGRQQQPLVRHDKDGDVIMNATRTNGTGNRNRRIHTNQLDGCEQINDTSMMIDSGAGKTCCHQQFLFDEIKPLDRHIKIVMADGTSVPARGVGRIKYTWWINTASSFLLAPAEPT